MTVKADTEGGVRDIAMLTSADSKNFRLFDFDRTKQPPFTRAEEIFGVNAAEKFNWRFFGSCAGDTRSN